MCLLWRLRERWWRVLQVIGERSRELEEVIASEGGLATAVGDDDYPGVIGKRRRLAFLDMLLYESKRGADLDFLDIREEVDTFMFEVRDVSRHRLGLLSFMLFHALIVHTLFSCAKSTSHRYKWIRSL